MACAETGLQKQRKASAKSSRRGEEHLIFIEGAQTAASGRSRRGAVEVAGMIRHSSSFRDPVVRQDLAGRDPIVLAEIERPA